MTTISLSNSHAAGHPRPSVPVLAAILQALSLVLAIAGLVISSNATVIVTGLLAACSGIALSWTMPFADRTED